MHAKVKSLDGFSSGTLNQKILVVLFLGSGIGLGFTVTIGDWASAVQIAMAGATVFLGMEAATSTLEYRKSRRAELLRHSLENLYGPIVNLIQRSSQNVNTRASAVTTQVDELLDSYGYLLNKDLYSQWSNVEKQLSSMGYPMWYKFIKREINRKWFDAIKAEYEKLREEHQSLIEK